MGNSLRKVVHRYIPAHLHDPFGSFVRIVRSRDPAALFAVETALLGMLFTPLDLLLQIPEKWLYQRAPKPKLPLIFVCGASRTGTTLVAQVLIRNLPVSFINNLTAVFPRSPIVANCLFGKLIGSKEIPYQSYYGKSVHFSGPNDALYIWDRWLGKDRTQIRPSLTESEKRGMIQFFGAHEQRYRRPLVNKNNSLNVQANVVAEVFHNAFFICMMRDPAYLAQSLLIARKEIQTNIHVAYGIDDPHEPKSQSDNYIDDVCKQVLFHERKIKEQQQLIGSESYWIVQYEEFCKEPGALVQRVSEQILGQPIQIDGLKATLKPFKISNRVRLESEEFERIEETLARLKGDAGEKQAASVPAISA